MSKLKSSYKDINEIPEHFHDLYLKTENGEFVFNGVEDCEHNNVKKWRTENGERRISEKKAKDDLAAVQTSLAAWGDLKPEDVTAKLARMQELEESSRGKVPEEKLKELAEARAKAAVVPYEKRVTELTAQLTSANSKIGEYEAANNRTLILEHVRAAADSIGFSAATYASPQSALNLMALSLFRVADGQVTAAGGGGFTEGMTVKEVLPELLNQHPYLSKTSEGGGAPGSGGSRVGSGGPNVFKQNNMTLRMDLLRTNPKEAERQMRAAGLKDETQQYVERR